MPASKRLLEKWRKKALEMNLDRADERNETHFRTLVVELNEANRRILVLTQELLDQFLMKKGE